MQLFKKLFGYRWSLYVVQNEKELVYAMHENSVIRMIGYVMKYFAGGATPEPPWSLHLNFNHAHKSFKLEPCHFTEDGENITSALMSQIRSIDPDYEVKGSEPVFEEANSKKKISIRGNRLSTMDLSQPKEITFFDIMDVVFGKR